MPENNELVEQVENLNDEVKEMAMNLAVYLSKKKKGSDKLNSMEPEFIKLVNGTIKVVQEITHIINAARHNEKMIYEIPSGRITYDQLETKLNLILKQCQDIMQNLVPSKDLQA